jgi:SAM-dependent methyltransferase
MINSLHFNSEERAGWEQIWRSGNIPPRYQSFAAPNPAVVEWVETVTPGGFVLDVGCGVGRHVLYLGECGFRVAGVDISPSGIRLAQAACAERQITFDGRVSDMTTLPWPDMSFDAALSTSTIHHQRRAGILQTLAEVRRILKPGGLFLVDFPCTDTITYQELRGLVIAGQLTEAEPDTFVDERPDSEDPDGFLPHHFCDEADVRDLLHAFDIIRLWADLHEAVSESGTGLVGKWVAWARKAPIAYPKGVS